jgi:hypothetical protein
VYPWLVRGQDGGKTINLIRHRNMVVLDQMLSQVTNSANMANNRAIAQEHIDGLTPSEYQIVLRAIGELIEESIESDEESE